jgi:hypothetical protein
MEKSNARQKLLNSVGIWGRALWLFAVAVRLCFTDAAEAGSYGEDLVKANMGLVSLRYSSTLYAYLDYKEEVSADNAYNEHYAKDHLPLVLTVWENLSDDTAALYKNLASNDVLALSFAESLDRAKFEAQNPTYASHAASYFDLGADYKKRVQRRQDFALATLKANNTEANASLKTRAPDMLKLNVSSLAALGYRQGLQAGSQTANFMNQGFVLLRMDMQRQLEMETFFALDEMRENSDGRAAFGGGIKWQSQNSGKDY